VPPISRRASAYRVLDIETLKTMIHRMKTPEQTKDFGLWAT
jgi:hypothetical protein